MQNFTCRVLTPDDAEKWQDLRIEGARDFPLGFLVTLEETRFATHDRCREILGAGHIRGVFSGERLVGFAGYRPQQLARTRHRGEIGPFFVTRNFHGTGAARALMAKIIEEAKANGLAQLELFVDTENLQAATFYERQGFKRIATLHDTVRVDGLPRKDHFLTLQL